MSFKTTTLLFGALIAGAAAGFAGGYFFAKNKYQEKADKEIADVKKLYESHFAPKEENNENNSASTNEVEKASVNNDSISYGTYTDYAGKYAGETTNNELPPQILKGKSKKSMASKKPPYIISDLQLGELEDYRVVTLMYYSDKVLADEDGNIIKNFNEVVGPDALNNFTEHDAVYVRDDNLKIDYEILLDERLYSEVCDSDE